MIWITSEQCVIPVDLQLLGLTIKTKTIIMVFKLALDKTKSLPQTHLSVYGHTVSMIPG